jgi:hypothetical protein
MAKASQRHKWCIYINIKWILKKGDEKNKNGCQKNKFNKSEKITLKFSSHASIELNFMYFLDRTGNQSYFERTLPHEYANMFILFKPNK